MVGCAGRFGWRSARYREVGIRRDLVFFVREVWYNDRRRPVAAFGCGKGHIWARSHGIRSGRVMGSSPFGLDVDDGLDGRVGQPR